MNNHNAIDGALIGTILAICMFLSQETSAQDCSELSIDHLWYGAFSDTAFEVGLLHSGGSQFNYPSFGVVDAGSDTLTADYWGLFVLPWGHSIHSVALRDGVPLPSSPFNGQILLHHAGDPDSSVCAFPLNAVDLCPSGCVNAWIDVYQAGSPVTSNLSWVVRDTTGSAVAYGDMLLNDTDHTQEVDSMCLAPGHYTIEIAQSPFEMPASFVCSFFRDPFYIGGPSFPFAAAGTLAFDWFPACFASSMGIGQLTSPTLSWSLVDGQLAVTSADGHALGSLVVHDARGALVQAFRANGDRMVIDLSSCAPGLYIAVAQGPRGRTAHRVLLD